MDRNICSIRQVDFYGDVVPYVGTWIEILSLHSSLMHCFRRSLRGNVDRNFDRANEDKYDSQVVPYVGTWIEIVVGSVASLVGVVVPYVGTWIEIPLSSWRR